MVEQEHKPGYTKNFGLLGGWLPPYTGDNVWSIQRKARVRQLTESMEDVGPGGFATDSEGLSVSYDQISEWRDDLIAELAKGPFA